MYIIDPAADADKITSLNETISQLIEKEGGTIVRMDDIGRRNLGKAPSEENAPQHSACPVQEGTLRATTLRPVRVAVQSGNCEGRWNESFI